MFNLGEYSALSGIHDSVFDVLTRPWVEYSRVRILALAIDFSLIQNGDSGCRSYTTYSLAAVVSTVRV